METQCGLGSHLQEKKDGEQEASGPSVWCSHEEVRDAPAELCLEVGWALVLINYCLWAVSRRGCVCMLRQTASSTMVSVDSIS